ncbi:LacI family DNA-binding transcriptional regulator [Mucilaginibacter phyllosphaerae]|uniref:DNA-binding LacI/PurR family transcriptional regulator n=1 Tax=Mucilaginibacter phyllosphaerae TaxID=1812349 RepID=A0A4Y8AH91_9SPHI|nr:LacI family DNA-binding transcriptional regulator [Mucilaginibacter phyllosphaerae]MBB3968702.1 DNA-binding LacI/PurR family transcriptional regulator [Mucilaginibacter phyllosphaerae]TEW67662.1 LacI family DNA-binding transcriptional regulator [Mucilaginibacter phyllosphaerae]GGH14392.1 LacI family transcriptional regulator [Mucilaginibacter phyllosphaerae]
MYNNKLPTIKEIARRLNVSASTVSRALHHHPSIGLVTTMRVHKVAQELGYEANKTAIYFKERKTYTIGVIIPDLSEPFFSSALTGIEDAAEASNYNVIIGQSLDNFEREKKIVENMKNHRVDGVLVSLTKETSTYAHFDSLKKYNIPVVFFDRVPNRQDINYVACNLVSGMLQAITKLVNMGHSRIGLINGPAKLAATLQRLEIYIQCLKQHHLPLNQDIIVSTTLAKADNRKAIDQLLSLNEPPAAVIVFNDYVLLDCIAAVKAAGLVVNKDISFISFANLPIWEYMESVPLASIEQFAGRQSSMAAGFLLQLINSAATPNVTEPPFLQHIIDSEMIDYTIAG